MSIFDNISQTVGALTNNQGNLAGIGGLVGTLVEKHGGIGGLVNAFETQGLGGIVQSWISTSTNQPITAAQIASVIGEDNLAKMAGKVGISPDEAAAKISQYLPMVVDKLTPNGKLPEGGVQPAQLMGALTSMMKQ